MFAVDHVLVSDDLLDAPFACHLGSCLGGCCVHGDRGAPITPDERAALDAAFEVVRDKLPADARAEIARTGTWEGNDREGYHTATVGGGACVFVVTEHGVAKCAIQAAYWAGKLDWEKPLSCHLYPIRVERYGEGDDAVDVLNYETIDLCRPAVPHGRRTATQLADFLERPLTRAYGEDWFARFRDTLDRRRDDLGIAVEGGA